MKNRGKVFIGTSGYTYPHWRDRFYPPDISQSKWLEYYTRFFCTVELNVTFYRLPKKEAFLGWYRRTPEDFTFAVKGSRFITHIKRLNIAGDSLKLLFSRITHLREKLGVVLWQLPPKFKADKKRFANFLKELRSYRRFRHAFEFRDETWQDKEIFRLIEEEGACLCKADWPAFSEALPQIGNFVYIRRHGAQGELYGGCYSKRQIQRDAEAIETYIMEGKDVFIYFNNDAQAWAIKNALSLKEILRC